jgi:hypothetical protein
MKTASRRLLLNSAGLNHITNDEVDLADDHEYELEEWKVEEDASVVNSSEDEAEEIEGDAVKKMTIPALPFTNEMPPSQQLARTISSWLKQCFGKRWTILSSCCMVMQWNSCIKRRRSTSYLRLKLLQKNHPQRHSLSKPS